MNAAFLLVTSACFAGQTPELVKPPMGAPPVITSPAPVTSTVIPGGCGSSYSASCDSCCDTGHHHRWFGGGHHCGGGLFHHRNSCDTGCDSCGTSGHGHGCHQNWSWHHSSTPSCGSCSTCENYCDSCCDSGHKHSLFGRFHGIFGGGHGHHATNDCCDSCYSTYSTAGCAGGGCAPSVAPAPSGIVAPGTPLPHGGEIINAPPKKMPLPPPQGGLPPQGGVPIPSGPVVNPPVTPPVTPPKTFGPAPDTGANPMPPINVAPATPTIEVVPPATPAVPSITNQPRSPF